VLADRCTDQTAAKARAAGADVWERAEGSDGKGAVLRWFLETQPLAAEEALVVVDADNRVPTDFLARLSDEIDGGGHVLQAYLDVSNPDASPIATASALSYWASNRMVQLARRNLDWTADLGGTGMCITAAALAAGGGFGESLVEDQELGVRLFLAGHDVRWLHDVRIADEKPSGAGVAIRQRSRWVAGRRHVARVYLGRLLRRRSPASWDLALRLIQPSRMGVALLSAVLALASALGASLWPWWLWVAIGLVQVLAPIPFLLRDQVPGRYVWRYPLLILLPLIKIPARLFRTRGWYHTPHEGDR
jgi:cellulose synthase/poly-beta-1,6-N-acetylglucosamine synthase-like glycosyltransferase